MKYIYKNLVLPVNFSNDMEIQLQQVIYNRFPHIKSYNVLRRAIDCRKKNHPVYVYTIEFNTDVKLSSIKDIVLIDNDVVPSLSSVKLHSGNPYIIGMGPSGLFSALAMVENGLKPILFDRGDPIEIRTNKVNKLWNEGVLDPESNVQFGEGGAGCFSDGKLTSRSQNIFTKKVFEYLVRFGASKDILWDAHPHLGTDMIRDIITKIRKFLTNNGCQLYYNHRLDNLSIKNGKLQHIEINTELYKPEVVILALGNSSRDTFELLSVRGVFLQQKPFAIGVRIVHQQEWINRTIYGSNYWSEILGPASYRLSAPKAGKGTYTFCMCPGGYVILSSNEPMTIVTNGMSYSSRNSNFGNSGIVTNIDSSLLGNSILAGIRFQLEIEKRAFKNAYVAPVQSAKDFIGNTLSSVNSFSILFPDSKTTMISEIFPKSIIYSIKKALLHFEKILPGFISEGILVAPETRSSSPIRILRDKIELNCLGISNLYAIGEGSGYAGGIISSASDGYRIGSMFYA